MNSNHRTNGLRRGSKSRSGGKRTQWADLPEEELLKLRICDLGLQIEGTVLEDRIERLYEELEYRHIRFRPHFWLGEEWFSPDGIPGIAIPFYLAHPRLMRLERRQMLEVEGGTEDWCLKILRHEVGHTLDTAYRLHRRKRYREVFGNYSQPYPNHYYPKPYSKNYVLHLEPAYAQAHPAEDFAETFAVWLKPRSPWRANYEGWPVIKKLEYVDELMDEIREEKPAVVSREHIDSLRTVKVTLGEHYAAKRNRYRMNLPNLYDQHLRKLFSDSPENDHQPSAAKYLRHIRGELRETVARWTGEHQYTIDQVLREIIDRCQQLKLRLGQPMSLTKRDALVLLTVQTMNILHGGHHRVAL